MVQSLPLTLTSCIKCNNIHLCEQIPKIFRAQSYIAPWANATCLCQPNIICAKAVLLTSTPVLELAALGQC